LSDVYMMLQPAFHDLILEDQNCFASEEGWRALLHLIPDNDIVKSLQDKWEEDRTCLQKAGGRTSGAGSKGKKEKGSAIRNKAREDIVLQYTHPRLVSKHRDHLLKAPFFVHLNIGRVCVHIDPRTVDKSNPARVSTVSQLLNELDKLALPQAGEGAEQQTADIVKVVRRNARQAYYGLDGGNTESEAG
ncbi:hypothetical protein C8T65DRAFT_761804, partial [Cerioporus squamosus]